MATEESVVSFMRLSRTLLSCNEQQLSLFIPQIVQIFNESNQIQLLQQILHKGLASFYKQIPYTIYQQTQSVAPTKLIINDSISNDNKEECKDDNIEDLTDEEDINYKKELTDLPKDLLLHSLNFLSLEDICNISCVCRYLLVICHDNNAVHHLDIVSPQQYNAFIRIHRYQRAKSLKLNIWRPVAVPNEIKIFDDFRHLQSLSLRFTFSTLYDDIVRSFPQNINLNTFILNCRISTDSLYSLLNHHLNPMTLKHLCLPIEPNIFNEQTFKAFMRFKNLKKLSLETGGRIQSGSNNMKSLIKDKNYNGNLYPFKLLEDIELNEYYLLEDSFCKEIIIWMMQNGIKKKILRLECFECLVGDTIVSLLPNVKELFFTSQGLYNRYSRNMLLKINEYYKQNCHDSLNHFQLKIDTTWTDLKVFHKIDAKPEDKFLSIHGVHNEFVEILKNSKSSHLMCNTHDINVDILSKLMRNCLFDSVYMDLENMPHCLPNFDYIDEEHCGWDGDPSFLSYVCNEEIESRVSDVIHVINWMDSNKMQIRNGTSFCMHLKHSHQYFVLYDGVSVGTETSKQEMEKRLKSVKINDKMNYQMTNNDRFFRFECQIECVDTT